MTGHVEFKAGSDASALPTIDGMYADVNEREDTRTLVFVNLYIHVLFDLVFLSVRLSKYS